VGPGGPARPGARARRLADAGQAGPRAARGLDDLRAARPRLLHHGRDRPRGAPRHLPGLRRDGQRRHAPPARARPGRAEHAAPAAGERHRDHRGGPRRAARARLRPRILRACVARPAGVHRPDPRPGRLQLGLRPAALHDARGLLRHGSRRAGAHARVPRDGQGHQRRRPARGHGRRLQPHAGRGPGPEVDPRPDRPGLLPAAVAHGRRRDLHVLCQHGVRAPDDGEAHGRVRRDLGAALQGRRLPLRPHGPPLQGQHARGPPRPGRADAGARRGRRQADLRLRRGLELRRGGRRPALRAGHPAQHGGHGDRDVLRPPARRRPRRRALRRRPARAGLRHRAVHGPQRRAGERVRPGRPAPARARPDQGRAGGQPARLPLRGPDGPDRHGRAGGLQRPARGLRRGPERDDHLRRRPRQRDAVRRPAVQAAAEHVDGRPGADEHGGARDDRAGPEPVVLARRGGPAALQVAGPQLLQLGRLVQPDRLVGPRVDVGLGAAARRGQRGQVAVHAAAARGPGAEAGRGRHRGSKGPRGRAAADPLLLTAPAPGHRRADPGARQLPDGRAGPDARGDRHGDRRP
ncbi:MAG: GH13_13 / GH13_37 / GH13 / GH13_32 / GH13_ 14 / GH13_11, partial [uncultured Nocardioidaceae bacterium]